MANRPLDFSVGQESFKQLTTQLDDKEELVASWLAGPTKIPWSSPIRIERDFERLLELQQKKRITDLKFSARIYPIFTSAHAAEVPKPEQTS